MAGQLGLDSPTMDLCVGGPTAELEQALKNSEAVAACFNASIFTSTFLFVVYCSARLTSSEKKQVEEKLKNSFNSSDGPTFLYILASDLPKG
jgi:diphthine-ammonia ligase